MIAHLTGTVVRTALGVVVLSVNGVGYLVTVSPKLAASSEPGKELNLHTAMVVREDAHLLFGFSTLEELEMFDLLRSVSGVGPKSALGIVSFLGVDEIRNAVAGEDDAAFSKVSGIGPKTAKLITVTLAGKLQASSSDIDQELVSALVGLGYRESDVKSVLRKVSGETQQERLRAALAELARA